MKLTKNQLRVLHIFNPYNLAREGRSKLYIDYIPGESGRMAQYPHWLVVGIGFKVDPNGSWYDMGNKTFDVTCRENKEAVLSETIAWCFQKFAIPKDQWEKDPFGGYQIKGTIQKAVNNQKDKAEK